jgi:hypothetical protein
MASRGKHQTQPGLVYMFAIMIDDGISAGDEAERERGREGESGEKEHLKCGHAETGRCDEPGNGGVLHAGIRHQHPKIADCDRQIPKGHDRPFHRKGRLAVGEFEPSGRDQHFAKREQGIRQYLPGNRERIAVIEHQLHRTDCDPRQTGKRDTGSHPS